MTQDELLPTYPSSSLCERDKKTMEEDLVHIHAPYNFVPLNDWVYRPDPKKWGNKASHDLPFKDGLSGTIEYTLVAHSPLLVGGKHKIGNEDIPGEVCFARSPDGEYIIPGSSVRGMLRSVVEIASFGRMRIVDDARYSLRDMTNSLYKDKVSKRNISYGLMEKNKNGEIVISPCKKADWEHEDLKNELLPDNHGEPLFKKDDSVKEKYTKWAKLAKLKNIKQFWFKSSIENGKWVDFEGNILGFPVFTTQISESTEEGGKHKDFIFHSKDDKSIRVRDKDWEYFLLTHDENIKEENKEKSAWSGFWNLRFKKNGKVPVFYLNEGIDEKGQTKLRIGLAQLPKLAWDLSIKEMIENTHKDHVKDPQHGGDYDMADLLFGTLADKPNKHLKGRVNFGMLKVNGNPIPEETETTILSSPKPTYYPNYLQQPAIDGKLQRNKTYNTGLVGGGNNLKPQIRGFKRYPARIKKKIGTQPLTEEQKTGPKTTQVILYPLPEKTQFTGQISFHNLRSIELGALLWAMTWGSNRQLRHNLGMGKPFGYGQVELDITDIKARRNITPNKLENIEIVEHISDYIKHMQKNYAKKKNSSDWLDSPQIKNLLRMANPQFSNNVNLTNMCLTTQGGNEFYYAKQSKLVLREYTK